MPFALMVREARFSPCRTWRYSLTRRWDHGPYLNVIGLNPSTADENLDDPTVRRCLDFARRWGYSGLVMTNLFGYRSTDPRGLRQVEDPVGPETTQAIIDVAARAGRVLAAWGTHGTYQNRDLQVGEHLVALGIELCCLGLTAQTRLSVHKRPQPRHPLYLPAATLPEPYDPSASTVGDY